LALGDGSAGLALKVQDVDIVLDAQHLPEMQVTVMADFQEIQGGRHQ